MPAVLRLAQDWTCSRAYSHQRNLVTMDSSALEELTDLHFVCATHIFQVHLYSGYHSK